MNSPGVTALDMMRLIDINTPAILFPAVSLLMLAYTNRYLALASLIRKLHNDYMAGHEPAVRAQIENLRFRMRLIRQMQAMGMMSLLCCLVSVILVLTGLILAGTVIFAAGVVIMAASILQCLREILRSGGALDILLREMESDCRPLSSQARPGMQAPERTSER